MISWRASSRARHVLGTDQLGRDSTRASPGLHRAFIGFCTVLLTAVVGGSFGLSPASSAGGRRPAMRIADVQPPPFVLLRHHQCHQARAAEHHHQPLRGGLGGTRRQGEVPSVKQRDFLCRQRRRSERPVRVLFGHVSTSRRRSWWRACSPSSSWRRRRSLPRLRRQPPRPPGAACLRRARLRRVVAAAFPAWPWLSPRSASTWSGLARDILDPSLV